MTTKNRAAVIRKIERRVRAKYVRRCWLCFIFALLIGLAAGIYLCTWGPLKNFSDSVRSNHGDVVTAEATVEPDDVFLTDTPAPEATEEAPVVTATPAPVVTEAPTVPPTKEPTKAPTEAPTPVAAPEATQAAAAESTDETQVASADTADPGDTVIWTAVGGGGTSPYAYAFRLYRDGELIQSTNYSRTRTYSYSFETGGSYYVLHLISSNYNIFKTEKIF